MINLNEIMKNEIKEKQKKFYKENKNEIINEINGKYNIVLKKSQKQLSHAYFSIFFFNK